jgi:hypothetical protein
LFLFLSGRVLRGWWRVKEGQFKALGGGWIQFWPRRYRDARRGEFDLTLGGPGAVLTGVVSGRLRKLAVKWYGSNIDNAVIYVQQ